MKGQCSVTVGEQKSGYSTRISLSQAQLFSLVSICHPITAARFETNGSDLAAKNRLQVLLIGTFFSRRAEEVERIRATFLYLSNQTSCNTDQIL